jgi:ABC-type polysaccharide/polyol phosphate export permease
MWGLSFSLAKFRFKLKNEGSYLGIIWYLLSPLLLFMLLFFIFNDRMGNNIPKYPLYLLTGIIMFNFFQSATLEATTAVLNNRGLIKSIKFQRESLIFSELLKALFSHIFEVAVFIIFMVIFKVNLAWMIVYPVIIAFFFIFIYGISLALSAFTVHVNDVQNIWSFVTKLFWFATPIFYAIGGQTRLFMLNLVNPLYYFITIARETLVYNRMPELWMMIAAGIFSLSSFIIGFLIFNKSKKKFAERI